MTTCWRMVNKLASVWPSWTVYILPYLAGPLDCAPHCEERLLVSFEVKSIWWFPMGYKGPIGRKNVQMTRQGKPTPFATYLKCFAELTNCSWLTQSWSHCSCNCNLKSNRIFNAWKCYFILTVHVLQYIHQVSVLFRRLYYAHWALTCATYRRSLQNLQPTHVTEPLAPTKLGISLFSQPILAVLFFVICYSYTILHACSWLSWKTDHHVLW